MVAEAVVDVVVAVTGAFASRTCRARNPQEQLPASQARSLGPVDHLQPNPDEVDSIHAISFTELCRDDSPNLESIPQSDRQVLSMNYQDDAIYAPTAALLYQFQQVAILGQATRVLHFDQPVFAWR